MTLPPRAAITAVHGYVPPDLLTNAELARLVETYAADEDPLLVSDFANSLRAAYRPEEIHAQLRAAELALNVEVISDRHIAIWGTR